MAKHERIILDVNNMMAEQIGLQYGIAAAQVEAMIPAARMAQANVERNRGKGWQGWMDLPRGQRDVVARIKDAAARIREYDAFVVLGIGGSALGPIAVQQALNHLRWNELTREQRGGYPKLYVEDNVDPERMASLLDVIDIKRTCFNVITKSGRTAETMSQYMIITDRLKKEVGDGWQKQMIATTDETGGILIKIAQEEGLETFFIPSGVGGRFSELSPVGLLAAAVCGIDIDAMLDGAAMMDDACKEDNIWLNPALLEAVLQHICMTEMDVNIQVVMPYADSLKSIADWFCQLWAESLGKNVTRKGMAVNAGQTPVKALGVTDQHSQLQLYTEGPYDKVITLLRVGKFRKETPIPEADAAFTQKYPDIAFLGGKSHNALIDAEMQGTEYALYRAGRMSQTITLPEVNAHTIGQLLYFFEMATAYAGELLDIDAFNQPGVEESKVASYAVLGNESEVYAHKRAEMQQRPERMGKFIL